MNPVILHYIYDPLCGWCYGAAPLVKAAREVVAVRAHAGGMMTGPRRQPVTPHLREFVMTHDKHIAQLTGQHFSDAYFNGLLRNPGAVFDSEPPIAAMLAAEQIAGRGLDIIARLQIAHYVEGRLIADREVLIEVAETMGLSREGFAKALDHQTVSGVLAHIQATRRFMNRVGAKGFPTFALEARGTVQIVEINGYLGQPGNLQAWLRTISILPDQSGNAHPVGCDADHCIVPPDKLS